jgi:signal transduction histidine kinase
MSRASLLLILGLLFAALAWIVQEPDPHTQAERERLRLQERLDEAARDLQQATQSWVAKLDGLGAEEWMMAHGRTLEAQREREGVIFMGFSDDSLVCWTGEPGISPKALALDSTAHLVLSDVVYLHSRVVGSNFVLHGLRPIWLSPPIENNYLRRGFHPSFRVPNGLVADLMAGSGPGLRDREGKEFLHIAWREGALEIGTWLLVKLLLVALTILFLVWAMWLWAMRSVRNGRPWTAATVFILILLGARIATLTWISNAPFDRLPLFDPAIFAASFAFPSLGDLLLNAILFFTVGLFLNRALQIGPPFPRGAIVAVFCWSLILLLAAWVTRILIGLVNDSSISMDLYHIQGLNSESLLALLGMALFLGAWWLVANALITALLPGKRTSVLVATGLGTLAISIVIHQTLGVLDTALFLWPVPLILILIRSKHRGPSFVQVVLGLACFALLAAHVLTRYTGQREQRERLVLAERLATREDPVVEQLFRDIAPILRSDRSIYGLLNTQGTCAPGELDRLVRQRFFTGYWERYDVRLFAFGTNGQVLCATDSEPPRSFTESQSAFTDPSAIADMPDLFIEEQAGRSPFYHAKVAVMPVDTLIPGQLIIELYPRSAAQGLGFPSLLLAGEDPLAARAQRYTYARYENRQLVERSGNMRMPLIWTEDIGPEGVRWFEVDGQERLAKGDPEGTLIVLGSPKAGPLDKATTFSYLFVLLGFLLSIVLGIRTIVQARGVPALGIGAKVRLALVFFAIAGLVFFGIGTQRLVERQYEQRFEASILEKAASVHQELQYRFDGEPTLDQSHAAYLEHMLARLSNVFFSDITVYTTEGRMLATSRPQIFATGLLGPRMDPVAYERMALSGLSAFVHKEAIGTAAYRAAYMPLRDRKGTVLAYIALPGFADQAQQEQERADVLVAVVNLFVLLFALSVLIAVFISNWTTRPLDLLKNALARVGLQEANAPIRYRGDDEIGQLVDVYNRKVEELRESADRLARSERESAWREMARQVAHEIKNPLTPMKLNIQHFQRTWSPDAPDAAARLERFSTGMVEQIDTLSGIAGAFSNFAQMPRAQEEDLDLGEVAEAAMSLFDATPGVHCTLERQHLDKLPVRADREQLLRVFNNLLKNAVQSIPDEREGHIHLVLRSAAGEAIAEIHDNGSGIAEADKERIFRPNFTTKSSGMGLGLAMVQRMVETAGGRVWFETEEGKGSTFFVALPLRK